jgi:23S rRNA (pseudouridine1915-N3)-methyltransferase
MRLALLVVGKPRDKALAAAIHEYETRAARYWPMEVHEVREESARANTPAVVRRRESDRLAERLLPATQLVACDVAGEAMSSEQFASWLQRGREKGRDLAIVIGGAHGLSDELKARASSRLALAPWTLPHELARLVLAEQLYRAGTIVRGEPYHK